MNVAVTGRGGQLASEFERLKGSDPNWIFLSITDLDISDRESVLNYFWNKNFDFIINCAAFTSVDMAEDEIDIAYKVNETGVVNLIEACKLINSKLVHYSTDYVFDGKSSKPYHEKFKVNPKSVYGKSKLNGEICLIKEKKVKSIIIRTAWVYSTYGSNFVKTMIRLGTENKKIEVVCDQIGSPTYAYDLAKDSIIILKDQNYKWKNGDIFHYSNLGSCSWFDFAKKIFEIKKINVQLKPISTEEFQTRAIRPKFSLLDKTKFTSTFNIEIIDWEKSLKKMLKSNL